MNDFCVYKHTTPSGKSYIGITKQKPNKRWKNGKGYDLCTAFSRAIKKYGWDNITHEILEENLTKDEACKLEKAYISAFQSADPKYGYNLTLGGENYEPNEEWRQRARQSHIRYYAEHPEARQKISEQSRNRKASEETKRKMSESRKRYIAEHPEEREKCRNTFKGMKRSQANREKLRIANSVKIRCIETGEIFESVCSAAESIGVCRTAVSNQLKNRSKTCGGYHFEYYTVGGEDNAE